MAYWQGPLFAPAYCPLRQGDWSLDIVPFAMAPGYWSAPALVHDMAVLSRGGSAWMSMTPLEYQSQEIGIRNARGHVLIFGLGMGWAAAASACLPQVTKVTVVERDPDIVALHRELDLWAQLSEEARARLRIVEGDAFIHVPAAPVDLLLPDIWLPLVSNARLEEVGRMQANVGAACIYFWGQELELARHAVAAGRRLDEEGIAATAAETGLPLIGLDFPDFAGKVEAAARRWMRGRWMPGSAAPWPEPGLSDPGAPPGTAP